MFIPFFSFREVAGYSEEAPTVLGVSTLCISDQYLLALIALIPRWNKNFPRTVGLTFSPFHDGSIEQSDSAPTFLGHMQTGFKWWAISEYPATSFTFVEML